jgi:hypothetical protein
MIVIKYGAPAAKLRSRIVLARTLSDHDLEVLLIAAGIVPQIGRIGKIEQLLIALRIQ